jgi:hypothetical protein
MTNKEAKENIINNFRANYANNTDSTFVHRSKIDLEVFLLNAMEQLETIVKDNLVKGIKNLGRDTEDEQDLIKIIKDLI